MAAAVVVGSHVVTGFFPAFYFGGTEVSEAVLRTPLFVLWSGQMAVSVFFVLSGFVIAGSARDRTSPLIVTLISRYVRLVAPMLAAALLAYVLVLVFPQAPQRAAAISNSAWLASHFI